MNQEQAAKKLPSAFNLFRPSVQALAFNASTFIFQLAIVIGLSFLAILLISIAAAAESSGLFVIALLFLLASMAAGIVLNATLTLTMLRSAQGKRLSFEGAIREGLPYVWRLFLLVLITAVLVVVGLILLVVPGLFALQRLLLAPYFLIDKNLGVIEALKQSVRTAKQQPVSGAVWGLVGVLLLIGLVQIVPIIGGMVYLVASILFLCAPAVRYLEVVKVAPAKALAATDDKK